MLNTGHQPELSQHVQSRMQALYRPDHGPDAAIRRSLVELAGAQIAARRRVRAWRAALLAAAIALAGASVAIWSPWNTGGPAPTLLAAADPMDLNADGVVDMLDALAARRAVDSGVALNIAGSSGQQAVSAIAQRAVQLPRANQGAAGAAGGGNA